MGDVYATDGVGCLLYSPCSLIESSIRVKVESSMLLGLRAYDCCVLYPNSSNAIHEWTEERNVHGRQVLNLGPIEVLSS
jgi:hypothetical protein